METALKVGIAIALALVVAAGVGAVRDAIATATTASNSGVQFLHDQGEHTGYGVGDVLNDVVALVYPGTHDPDGSTLNPGSNGIADPIGRAWIWILLGAIPAALVTWMVASYLLKMLLGS